MGKKNKKHFVLDEKSVVREHIFLEELIYPCDEVPRLLSANECGGRSRGWEYPADQRRQKSSKTMYRVLTKSDGQTYTTEDIDRVLLLQVPLS